MCGVVRKFEFEQRTSCPVCGGESGSILLDALLDERPLSAYLTAFYDGRSTPNVCTVSDTSWFAAIGVSSFTSGMS